MTSAALRATSNSSARSKTPRLEEHDSMLTWIGGGAFDSELSARTYGASPLMTIYYLDRASTSPPERDVCRLVVRIHTDSVRIYAGQSAFSALRQGCNPLFKLGFCWCLRTHNAGVESAGGLLPRLTSRRVAALMLRGGVVPFLTCGLDGETLVQALPAIRPLPATAYVDDAVNPSQIQVPRR